MLMAPYRFDFPAQPYAPIPLGTLPVGQPRPLTSRTTPTWSSWVALVAVNRWLPSYYVLVPSKRAARW